MRPLTYTGSRILITGASSGLGVEFARRLAARGADLVLVARREERLRALADDIEAEHGVSAAVVAMDLAEPGAGAALRERLEAEGLRITGLVNNAGFGYSGALHHADADRTRAMVQLNVDTLVDLTCTFLDDLRSARSGAILVNIASLAAFQPNPGLAVYGATKAFVLNFSEALWEESRVAGLRVLALCPGPTSTEFFEVAGEAAGAGLPRMEAGEVVESALRALDRRHPPASVVPGALNTAASIATKRLLPTALVARTVGAMMRRGQGA